MHTPLLALAPLAVAIVGAAFATPSLAALTDDYMAACLTASSNNSELCTCKTEQARKLLDDEALGYLVSYMKDPAKFNEMVSKGEVPDAVVEKWPYYVRDSNKVCLPPPSPGN